ncbi:uncharacterized protein LOC117115470 isoform X2 [Anneissia japonica]|uniref:uncharacterized protein LOC117115470 isoform X2 n=1 Tax=Anneissia japonica TaxID=1529436 RepID=UPI001425AD7D|nr:uncharacterized protein LOC117115470 isoform X2 [Anneissia japonica]
MIMLPSLNIFYSDQSSNEKKSKTSSLFGFFDSTEPDGTNNNSNTTQIVNEDIYGSNKSYQSTDSGSSNQRASLSKQDSSGSAKLTGSFDRYSTPDEYDPEEPGRFLDRLTSIHPEEDLPPYENGFESSSPSPTMSGSYTNNKVKDIPRFEYFESPSDPGMPPISAKLTREDLTSSYRKPGNEDKSTFMKTLEASPLGFFFKSDDAASKNPESTRANYGQPIYDSAPHASHQFQPNLDKDGGNSGQRGNASLPSGKPPSYSSIKQSRTSHLRDDRYSVASVASHSGTRNGRYNSMNGHQMNGTLTESEKASLNSSGTGKYKPSSEPNSYQYEGRHQHECGKFHTMHRNMSPTRTTENTSMDSNVFNYQVPVPGNNPEQHPSRRLNGKSAVSSTSQQSSTMNESGNFHKMHRNMSPTSNADTIGRDTNVFSYQVPVPRNNQDHKKQNGVADRKMDLISRPTEQINQQRPMNTSFYEISCHNARRTSTARRRSSDIDTHHIPFSSMPHWVPSLRPDKPTQFSYVGRDLPEPRTVLGSRENLKRFARGADVQQAKPKISQAKNRNEDQKKTDNSDAFSFFGIFGEPEEGKKDDGSIIGYFKSFQDTAEKELEDSTLLLGIFGRKSTAKPSKRNAIAVPYHRGVLYFGPLFGKVSFNALRHAARFYCKKNETSFPKEGQEARTFAEIKSQLPGRRNQQTRISNRSSDFFDRLDSMAGPSEQSVTGKMQDHNDASSSTKEYEFKDVNHIPNYDSKPETLPTRKMSEPSRLPPHPMEPDLASISPDISDQLDYTFADSFSAAPYLYRNMNGLISSSSMQTDPDSKMHTGETIVNDPKDSIFSLIELFENLEEYEHPVTRTEVSEQKNNSTQTTISPDPKRNDSSKPSSHDLDHYKRVFARQRAKDLADHAQKLLAKDKEISDLRQAVDRLQNSSRQPDPNVRNSKMYSEKDELERIVRQHAKEQLRLQRCLSAASAHDPSGNTIGYQALEETNKALRKELNDFEQSNIQAQQLEAEVAQQRLECDNLQKEIENEHKRSSVLTSELQDALVENTNLTRQNTQLQERLTKLETFEEECKRLSEALKQQQSLFEASVDEKNNLKQTVAKLEKEVKLMQAAAEKRKQLEKEHEEAILSLQFKQDEIRNLQKEQQQSKREHHDSVSKLEDKVKDLEKRYEEQSANVGKLTQELQNLRKVTNKTMEEIAVQTQEKELNKSNEVARAFATKVSTAPNQSKGENLEEVFQLPESKTKEDSGSIGTDVSSYCEKIRRLTLSDSEDDWGIGLGEALTKQSKIAVNGSLSDHALEDGLIGDRIMALADSNSDISLSQVEAFTDASEGETASLQQMSSQSKDDGLQGLEAQYYEALLNASSEEDGLIESLSNGLKAQAARSVETEKSEHFSQLSSSEAMSDEVFRNSEDLSKSGSLPSDNQARRVSSRKSKDSDEVDVSMLQRLQSASVNKLAVFIARYNYTPSSDSPNENPDAELPLKAGEYIYVYGDADEDGFYEGELMSGERGLVPGNFIERIADAKDLLDNPDGAVPMLMHTNHSHGSEDPMLEFQGIVHDSLSDSLNSDEDGARDDDFDRDSLMSYHVTMEKDSLSSFSHIASRESLKGFIFS